MLSMMPDLSLVCIFSPAFAVVSSSKSSVIEHARSAVVVLAESSLPTMLPISTTAISTSAAAHATC